MKKTLILMSMLLLTLLGACSAQEKSMAEEKSTKQVTSQSGKVKDSSSDTDATDDSGDTKSSNFDINKAPEEIQEFMDVEDESFPNSSLNKEQVKELFTLMNTQGPIAQATIGGDAIKVVRESENEFRVLTEKYKAFFVRLYPSYEPVTNEVHWGKITTDYDWDVYEWDDLSEEVW